MDNRIYGYIRVSTKEQNLDRQREALEEYAQKRGIEYNSIFEDKTTGKNFNRGQYNTLLSIVKSGDTIVIKELDRLGRNFIETPKELQRLFEKKVNVEILDTPLLHTGDEKLDYTINNMLIGFLSYIADKERKKIKLRVREELKIAKDKGIKLGRPERKLPQNFKKYYDRWKSNDITAIEFSKLLSVSRATLYRYINKYEVEGN